MLREVYFFSYMKSASTGQTKYGSMTVTVNGNKGEDEYLNLIKKLKEFCFDEDEQAKIVVTSITKLHSTVIDEVK